MFTGIIEEVGEIESIRRFSDKYSITINASFADELGVGDSVCVNGVCVTADAKNKKAFTADVMLETLSKTSIKHLRTGDFVNLERAMKANGRFDGHIVTGHTDIASIITNIVSNGNSKEIEIAMPENGRKYIVDRGSISLDGVSLTIASVNDRNFKVAIIPHTALITNLFHKRIGDYVNLEFDVLSKYVESQFKQKEPKYLIEMKDMRIDEDFLKQAGFLN
jgi:riboflavin synthase